tara:strand:+ start:1013 stop:2011 length:999 start_codon:yes stop_codon:yes gene_type:complete
MIYNYKISEYNLRKKIFAQIKNDKITKELINFENVHKLQNKEKINNLYSLIYNYFKTEEFQKIYEKFCNEIIKKHFKKNTRYQRIPSVRIQIPGSNSVNFHNDNFYGHDENVKNIWLPITNPVNTNSLYVCSEKISRKIVKEIKKNKLSINEINKLSRKYTKPLKINYGQYYLFNSRIIHGTLKNIEKETRVSIDFRFVETNKTGLKSHHFFKKTKENYKNTIKNCVSYFNKKKINDSLPSQKYQQLICLEYCKDNNLNNLKLETELSGFSHYPVLKDLIQNSGAKSYKQIVIFSEKNLPKNKKILNDLITLSKKKKITIHLISENKKMIFS